VLRDGSRESFGAVFVCCHAEGLLPPLARPCDVEHTRFASFLWTSSPPHSGLVHRAYNADNLLRGVCNSLHAASRTTDRRSRLAVLWNGLRR
jgi:hypothetical protein